MSRILHSFSGCPIPSFSPAGGTIAITCNVDLRHASIFPSTYSFHKVASSQLFAAHTYVRGNRKSTTGLRIHDAQEVSALTWRVVADWFVASRTSIDYTGCLQPPVRRQGSTTVGFFFFHFCVAFAPLSGVLPRVIICGGRWQTSLVAFSVFCFSLLV